VTRPARWIALASAALALAAQAAPITVRDDAGRTVTLREPARRIVTLAPFLTELAFSAGVGERVVGRSAFSDYPAAAMALPEVSSSTGPSLEGIAALAPDLALAWRDSIRDEDVTRLEALGVRVFVAQARTLEDPPRLLLAVARLAAGNDSEAIRYRQRIAASRRAHAALRSVPVLLEIWHQPLATLAGRHWMNEALAACGARNAFEDLPGIAPSIPWELVHARQPWAIVGAGSAASDAAFRAQWQERPALDAVAAGRLVFVQGDLIQRPSLRLADGVERLCASLDAVRK
jgi:iron complex transport system substrate-binding protein